MKKNFEEPQITFTKFELDESITDVDIGDIGTSGGTGEGEGGDLE